MSFAQIAARRPSDQPVCVIGGILAGLSEEEAEHLRSMLKADIKVWPHIGKDSIQAAIEEEGYGTIGEHPIRRHRAGTCACFREDR